MKPRPVTSQDQKIFPGNKQTFKCPPELKNCSPVETIISRTSQGAAIRIPWKLSAVDLASLQDNALEPTIWLTVFSNNLQPVDMELVLTDKLEAAPVAESADAEDLKSSEETHSGSSPDGSTNESKIN